MSLRSRLRELAESDPVVAWFEFVGSISVFGGARVFVFFFTRVKFDSFKCF